MRAGDALPEPFFTPTTKAQTGHDEPVTFAQLAERVGRETAELLRERTLAVFRHAAPIARARGLILVDTKLEWGRDAAGRLVLCDEALTPDSSRYWIAPEGAPALAVPGARSVPPEALDKQVVRDHLLSITSWNRRPPAPDLPPEVVIETSGRYLRLFRMLTGAPLL